MTKFQNKVLSGAVKHKEKPVAQENRKNLEELKMAKNHFLLNGSRAIPSSQGKGKLYHKG